MAFPETSYPVLATELSRLARQRVIQMVYKGYYTVIPVQYQARGIVPPLFYIDALMSHLDRPYYISLLSAAELHGAAHQRPQRFSATTLLPTVTTSRNELIQWSYRGKIRKELLWQMNSENGTVTYSSPELTAADLVQYEQRIGGLSRAATVLEELQESLDFRRHFDALLDMETTAALQRLGYLMEEILRNQVQSDVLFEHLHLKVARLAYVSLSTGRDTGPGVPRNERWKILINQDIQPDEI